LQNDCFEKDADLSNLKKEFDAVRAENISLKKQLEEEKSIKRIQQVELDKQRPV